MQCCNYLKGLFKVTGIPINYFYGLFVWPFLCGLFVWPFCVAFLMAFLCAVLSGLVTTFKVLY